MPHDRSVADAELLLDAINSMEEALVAYDADGRLLVCNDAFKKMYGYSDAQARPGVHFRELGEIDIARGNIVVEDEEGEDYLARKAAYRLRLEGSFTVKLRDGRWLRTTDRAMRGGGFVSVHVDVTELKEAQEAIRAAQSEAKAHQRELIALNADLEGQVQARTREIEVAMQLAEQRARTDSLTGLHNRGAFFEYARIVHDQALRSGRPYALAMLDIDQFKEINDRHGHQAGDAALASMAGTLCALGRSADVAGRIGGEEFALVLPDASAEGAACVAERLRGAVAGTPVPGRTESFCMTVSIGIALQVPGDGSVDAVMARADLALYQAKQQGRNRVVVSVPAP
jgi:diguanylate cyclase (GGDEF)-like protein/PAS domain S-box-containing protein